MPITYQQNRQLEHSDHQPSGITYPLCILAHDIDDSLNIGSLFRLADALGLEHIYLTGNTTRPPNPKIRKTSRGTEQHVPHSYTNEPFTVIQSLKRQHYKIIALEITSHSIELNQLKIEPVEKICLVVGSENTGIQPALLTAADICTHISMMGHNSSMNLAVASGIACHQIAERLKQ